VSAGAPYLWRSSLRQNSTLSFYLFHIAPEGRNME
jgi:hypothetical protein